MNTQPRKEEYVALHLLKEVVDVERYKNLIKVDRPDLQDNLGAIGVEVVSANCQDEKEAQRIIHRITSQADLSPDTQARGLTILQEKNYKPLIENHMLYGYSCKLRLEEGVNILRERIEKKVSKLQSYTHFLSNELFIIDQTDCCNEGCFHYRNMQLLSWYNNKRNNLAICLKTDNQHAETEEVIHFNRIFIFRYGYRLIDLLDIDNNEIEPIQIPGEYDLQKLYSTSGDQLCNGNLPVLSADA